MKNITDIKFAKAVKAVIVLAVAAVLLGAAASAIFLDSLPAGSDMMYHHGGDHEEEMILANLTWQSAVPAAAAVILGAAAVIVLWVAVCVFVYRKAEEADMNSTAWLIAALFLNLIGLAAFMIVRSVTREKCGNCGRWQRESRYCISCGAEFYSVCSRCGGRIRKGENFCSRCGKPVSESGAPTSGSYEKADDTVKPGEHAQADDTESRKDDADEGKAGTTEDKNDTSEKEK
ncbi:MAG: hypothetical protein ACI4LM_07440 [Anaerovoracaceae bacterium]